VHVPKLVKNSLSTSVKKNKDNEVVVVLVV
jgi:hypothetical protein